MKNKWLLLNGIAFAFCGAFGIWELATGKIEAGSLSIFLSLLNLTFMIVGD
jgi:hypothetical protein